MSQELEAKFRVDDFRAVRRSLKTARARYLGTALELDVFFDTPGRDLYRGGSGLRLRRVRVLRGVRGGRNSGWVLTVKGPKRRNSRLKVRREVETDVTDGEAISEILRVAGLVKTVTVQKRRSTFELDRCKIELDELPRIGRFVEIEGPNPRAVESARKKLNLPDEPITTSYLEMIVRPRR